MEIVELRQKPDLSAGADHQEAICCPFRLYRLHIPCLYFYLAHDAYELNETISMQYYFMRNSKDPK